MSKFIFTTTLAVLGLGLIATNAEAGGRRQCGVTYVAPPVAAAPVQTAAAQPQAQVQGYRAMSYEPATQFVAPVYRGTRGGGGGGQDNWKYQKTDPRKYR